MQSNNVITDPIEHRNSFKISRANPIFIFRLNLFGESNYFINYTIDSVKTQKFQTKFKNKFVGMRLI